MEWSWTTFVVSVGAVVVSAAVAWLEGNWTARPGLAMGFRQHAGMWGDALLLPVANAVIVPHVPAGPWIWPALAVASAAAVAAHVFWYRSAGLTSRATTAGCATTAEGATTEGRATIGGWATATGPTEHMWPARHQGTWHGDLSWAGWLHVVYVATELTLLLGFAVHPMPQAVVLAVVVIFSIHVPIGLLQPQWRLTGERQLRGHQLLAACLMLLWVVAWMKW